MERKFEDKLHELEGILEDLEKGNTDLETSIDKYVLAMKLVKECDEQLKNVEEQISKIVLENNETEDFKIEE